MPSGEKKKNPFEEQSNLTLEGEVNAGGSLSGTGAP